MDVYVSRAASSKHRGRKASTCICQPACLYSSLSSMPLGNSISRFTVKMYAVHYKPKTLSLIAQRKEFLLSDEAHIFKRLYQTSSKLQLVALQAAQVGRHLLIHSTLSRARDLRSYSPQMTRMQNPCLSDSPRAMCTSFGSTCKSLISFGRALPGLCGTVLEIRGLPLSSVSNSLLHFHPF